MDLTAQEESTSLLTSVRRNLRRDLRFLMFFLSPHLNGYCDDNAWYVANYKLPIPEIQRLRSDLLRSGLWRQGPGSEVHVQTSRLGLADNGDANMPLSDFMTMVTQVLTYLTNEKHCWAESHTVVTSHEVRRDFIQEVGQALEKFLERSKEAPGETTVSWSHISLNTLQALQAETDL